MIPPKPLLFVTAPAPYLDEATARAEKAAKAGGYVALVLPDGCNVVITDGGEEQEEEKPKLGFNKGDRNAEHPASIPIPQDEEM